MAYKPDVSDSRESPGLDIAQLLLQRGAVVSYSDPYVPVAEHGDLKLTAIPVEDAFARGIDCALITTNHAVFDYRELAERAPLIVDTRNALRGVPGAHIFRL
jgi:UDP-N-acetyl-D-glucosamine dehydrogenase